MRVIKNMLKLTIVWFANLLMLVDDMMTYNIDA